MYAFKLRLCADPHPHDWTLCPYAHEGEVARRRNPAYHSANPCSEYERTGACRRGTRCPFAHGVWERGLHPQRYRTLLCSRANRCTRPLCFFAHSETEVRKAVSSFETAIAEIKVCRRFGATRGYPCEQNKRAF
ncbi:hypothetical protein T484DRAFT_1610225 [Baffinella frigidus]|nr:hypothetical protein T484DRAFT_1610225 [Cryptophyta sp. CCMP2293]